MKAKRRHELKTNDLAHALEDLGHWFGQWGAYVVGGVAVVVIGFVLTSYMRTAQLRKSDQAYADLRKAASLRTGELTKSTEALDQSLRRIDSLIADSTDEVFQIEALIDKANLAMHLAEADSSGLNTSYLDKAEEAYKQVVAKAASRTAYCGRAYYGLFHVAADRFAATGEGSHRDTALSYIEKLTADGEFNGTPYQITARDIKNQWDDLFQTVEFPKRPDEPAPTPAVSAGPQKIQITPTPVNAPPAGATRLTPTTVTGAKPVTIRDLDGQSVEPEQTMSEDPDTTSDKAPAGAAEVDQEPASGSETPRGDAADADGSAGKNADSDDN